MSAGFSRHPHHVGAEALLPFAEDDGGRMVHVSAVRNGKKCGCICPECRGPLIAYHPKTKKVAYFGHHTAAACNPSRALETMLHRLAKQLIQQRLEVRLPPVVAYLGDTQRELSKGGVFRPESVRVEEAVPGMRPDIIATLGQKVLFIEVAVRHKVGAEKLALIRERRQPTIEIDLAKWRHMTDEDVLTHAIIHEAPRVWLFNATASDTEAAWTAKQEGRARKRRERAMELADAIVRDLRKPVMMEVPSDSVFARRAAAVEEAGMAGEVGVEIPGSAAFGVAGDIWQAVVLTLLLRPNGVTVQGVRLDNDACPLLSTAATVAHRDEAVDWTVVERATGGQMRDPRAAIRTYLDHLCERGIAMHYGGDHYAATWHAEQRAEAAREERRARRDRFTSLRESFEAVSEAVGVPSATYEAWMDTRHDGMEAAPREFADRGGREWSLLRDRMASIQRLATPDAAVVGGGLLGFPAEEHLAARIEDTNRRRREAEERKATRIAAEQARQAQEATDRLEKMRVAARDAGEPGIALLHARLDALGGRSIEETHGRMSLAEAKQVWDLIERRQNSAQRARAEEVAARAEAEKWREKLRRRVVELLGGTRGELVMRSRYPNTSNRALLDYCIDEKTYQICVTVALNVKRRS